MNAKVSASAYAWSCAERSHERSASVSTSSLIGFAVMLTRVESLFAGRAYAAYGGIYIAASLGWLWAVEGQRPTVTDWVGAGVAIVGAMIVIAFAGRS